jgi:hypothetical protein
MKILTVIPMQEELDLFVQGCTEQGLARMVQKPHPRGVEGNKDGEWRAWHRNGAPTAGKIGSSRAFVR